MATYGSVRSPRQGYTPAPLDMKPSNTGLIIAGVLLVAAVIGGVMLFSASGGGGGDNTPSPTAPPVGAAPTVVPASVPATAAPSSAIVAVTEDSGTFSVNLRGNLQVETAPEEAPGGFSVPRITASDDLAKYYADNTTFGVLVIAVGPDIGSEVTQVLGFLEPDESVCKERVKDAINTTLGIATRISLTGCGVDNLGTKVLLSIELPDDQLVVGLRMQDTGELAAIQSAALYILETMHIF
jgi:hypothetical protein